ncbi:hypothetical protein BGW80DRAFT_1294730 [Lactifluus volemus]|nr:hypothetical protein BGW80DRAFT_1294730 [Lactifluus volemus]
MDCQRHVLNLTLTSRPLLLCSATPHLGSFESLCPTNACMLPTYNQYNQTEPQTPPWPSLYDPLLEFFHLEHHSPIQPGGHYLTDARDVVRYTFFWTLIFHSLFFLITAGIACFNIIYPSRRDQHGVPSRSSTRKIGSQVVDHPMIPLTPVTSARSPDPLLSEVAQSEMPRPLHPRKNVRRSRVTYALFTLFTFLALAVVTSFLESVVIGSVLWAIFHAVHFNVSTWIPPIWALIIVSADVLGAFPSVIDRI